MRLLQPLKPFYSPGGARVDLGVTSTHYENDSIKEISVFTDIGGKPFCFKGFGRHEDPFFRGTPDFDYKP